MVLYHADIPGVHGGFFGVDVFFVISGFVITNVLLRERASKGTTSIPGFYARRIRRILPAATVVLIVTVFATYHWLSYIAGAMNANDAKYVAAFVGNFHFATRDPVLHGYPTALHASAVLVARGRRAVLPRVAAAVSFSSRCRGRDSLRYLD